MARANDSLFETHARDPGLTAAVVDILVMHGVAVIRYGTCGHGQLPRVSLGVTCVITSRTNVRMIHRSPDYILR